MSKGYVSAMAARQDDCEKTSMEAFFHQRQMVQHAVALMALVENQSHLREVRRHASFGDCDCSADLADAQRDYDDALTRLSAIEREMGLL